VASFAALLVGCGGGEDAPADRAHRPERQPEEEHRPEPPLEPARCPQGADNCESASGTIMYVERVDPDGDGDAHFILASEESISAPGVSIIDVRADLRPDPLPGPGDRMSASGPVYEGSYGQRQIQADVVNVPR
jgi:hypothetical protein